MAMHRLPCGIVHMIYLAFIAGSRFGFGDLPGVWYSGIQSNFRSKAM